jgi:hypothetical protein
MALLSNNIRTMASCHKSPTREQFKTSTPKLSVKLELNKASTHSVDATHRLCQYQKAVFHMSIKPLHLDCIPHTAQTQNRINSKFGGQIMINALLANLLHNLFYTSSAVRRNLLPSPLRTCGIIQWGLPVANFLVTLPLFRHLPPLNPLPPLPPQPPP